MGFLSDLVGRFKGAGGIAHVEVEADFTPLLRYLTAAQRKQIPFATAAALTRLAKGAREDVVAGLGAKFTIRNGWVARGIRAKPAEKRDWPYQASYVYSKDRFMEAQEVGGVKHGKAGGSTPQPLAIRPTKTDTTPRSKWPGAQLKRRGTFLRKLTKGVDKGMPAVLRREGAARYPLKVLYVLAPETKITPRLGMHETVGAHVGRNYRDAFEDALQRAMLPRGVKAPAS